MSETAARPFDAAVSGSADAAQSYRRLVLLLFRLSVLKQRKFAEIARLLGSTRGLRCLDIGSDNGVISYLLRRRGGNWSSSDLAPEAVEAIRAMVERDVFVQSPEALPFQNGELDRVVVIDALEHIADDARFAAEIARACKPGAEVIFNVPFLKHSLLRSFRVAIGQTDEAHGHLRHGYTIESLERALGPRFEPIEWRTYSRFFSEAIDTLLTWGIRKLKSGAQHKNAKGTFITGNDLKKYRKLLYMYAAVYPAFWFFGQLDRLLAFRSGYMLIAKFRVKP